MQSIIYGMREGMGNMFPTLKVKEKKAPVRAHTTMNVMDLLNPKNENNKLSNIKEVIREKPDIIIENDDKSS